EKMTVPAIHLAAENGTTALHTITKGLRKIPQVRKVVIFGSRVRGDFHGSSDLDVMIIIDQMDIEVKDKVIHILHEAELEYDVPLSPVLYTAHEYEMNKKLGSPFFERVEKEGIVLYDFERTRKN
ncbi:MAG: nucleotidyltransferase domain-containing protein, partial [Bacteroidota bacterium]|nr:nucleotidyltransferase domain-containing protein [Bacteroidota bacterium]